MGGVESTSEKKEEKKEERPATDTRGDEAINAKEWKRRYFGSLDDCLFGKDNGKSKKTVPIRPISNVSGQETSQPHTPGTRITERLQLNTNTDETKSIVPRANNRGINNEHATVSQERQNTSYVAPTTQANKSSDSTCARDLAPTTSTFCGTKTSHENAMNCRHKPKEVHTISSSTPPGSTTESTAITHNINHLNDVTKGRPVSSERECEKKATSALLKLDLSVKMKQQCSKPSVKLAPTWNESQSIHAHDVNKTQQRKQSIPPTKQQGARGTDPGKQTLNQSQVKTIKQPVTTIQIKQSKLSSRLPRPMKTNQVTPMAHDKIPVAGSNMKPNPVSTSKQQTESQLRDSNNSVTKTVVKQQPCRERSCPKQNVPPADQTMQTSGKPQEQLQQQKAKQQTQYIVSVKTSNKQPNSGKQVAESVKTTALNHAPTATMVVTNKKGPVVSMLPGGQKKVTSNMRTGAQPCVKHANAATKQSKRAKSKHMSIDDDFFMTAIQQLPKLAAKHLSHIKNSQKKPTRKLKPGAKKTVKPLQSGEVPVCFLVKEQCEQFSIGYSDDEDDDDEDGELETLLRSMLSNKILGWNAFQGLLYRYYKGEVLPREDYPRLASCTKPSKSKTSLKFRTMSEITTDSKMTKKQRKRKAKNKARSEKEPIENKQSQIQKILFSNKPEQELPNSNTAKTIVESTPNESISDMLQIDIYKPSTTISSEQSSKPCDQQEPAKMKQSTSDTKPCKQQQPDTMKQPMSETKSKEIAKATKKVQSCTKLKTDKQDKEVESTLNMNQQIANKVTGVTSKTSASNLVTSGNDRKNTPKQKAVGGCTTEKTTTPKQKAVGGCTTEKTITPKQNAVGGCSTEKTVIPKQKAVGGCSTEKTILPTKIANETKKPCSNATSSIKHHGSPLAPSGILQSPSQRLATGDASSSLHSAEIKNKSEVLAIKNFQSDKSCATSAIQETSNELQSIQPSGASNKTSPSKSAINGNSSCTDVAPVVPVTTSGTFTVPNATFTTGKGGPTKTSKYIKVSKAKQSKSIQVRRFGKAKWDDAIEETNKGAENIIGKNIATSKSEGGPPGKRTLKVKRRILQKTNTKLGLTNLDDIRFCRACADTKQRDGKGLFNCTKCDDVFYCSRQCQQDDWDDHKIFCKGFRSKCNRCHTFQKKIVNAASAATQP